MNTEINIDLLEKAARMVVKSVKSGQTALDMGHWNEYDRVDHSHVATEDDAHCGTSACFAGHCPFLPLPALKAAASDFYRLGNMDYISYLDRVFGVGEGLDEFGFFFDSEWGNDVDQVLARVLYYKKYGECMNQYDWEIYYHETDHGLLE